MSQEHAYSAIISDYAEAGQRLAHSLLEGSRSWHRCGAELVDTALALRPDLLLVDVPSRDRRRHEGHMVGLVFDRHPGRALDSIWPRGFALVKLPVPRRLLSYLNLRYHVPKHPRLPATARERARALASDGLSQAQIATRFGVSRQTVSRWIRESRIERPATPLDAYSLTSIDSQSNASSSPSMEFPAVALVSG